MKSKKIVYIAAGRCSIACHCKLGVAILQITNGNQILVGIAPHTAGQGCGHPLVPAMPVGHCDYQYPPLANPEVVQVHLRRESERRKVFTNHTQSELHRQTEYPCASEIYQHNLRYLTFWEWQNYLSYPKNISEEIIRCIQESCNFLLLETPHVKIACLVQSLYGSYQTVCNLHLLQQLAGL